MPLLKGKENIGHNIEVEEAAGKPHKQAVAIAMSKSREHDVQPVNDVACRQCGGALTAKGPGTGLCTACAKDAVINLTRGDKVACTTSEWAKGSIGEVLDVDDKGCKIEVAEPMGPNWFISHTLGYQYWPKSDWHMLKLLPRSTPFPKPQVRGKDAALQGEEYKAVTKLARELSLSYGETAEAWMKTSGTIKQRYEKARGMLMNEVQPVGDVEGFMQGGVFHPIDGSKGYSPKKAGGKGHGHQYYKNRKIKKGRAKDNDDAMKLALQAIKDGKTLGQFLRELPKNLSKEELQPYSTAYVAARGKAKDAKVCAACKKGDHIDCTGKGRSCCGEWVDDAKPAKDAVGTWTANDYKLNGKPAGYVGVASNKWYGFVYASPNTTRGTMSQERFEENADARKWVEANVKIPANDAEVNYKLAPVPPKPRPVQSVALRPEEVESVYKPHSQKELGKSFGKDFRGAGHNCDACGHQLSQEEYSAPGSWSYKCRSCGFKYVHGGKTLEEQLKAQGKEFAEDAVTARPTSMNEKPEQLTPGTSVYHTTGKQGKVHSNSGGRLMVVPDTDGAVPEEWDVRRTFARDSNEHTAAHEQAYQEAERALMIARRTGAGPATLQKLKAKCDAAWNRIAAPGFARDGFLYGGTGKLGPAFENECIQTQRDLQMLEETMNNETVQEGLVSRAMIWLAKAQNPKNSDQTRSSALVAARKDLRSAQNKQISRDAAPGKWSNGYRPAEKPSGKPQPTPVTEVAKRIKAKAKDGECEGCGKKISDNNFLCAACRKGKAKDVKPV